MSQIIRTSNFAKDAASYIGKSIANSIDSTGSCVISLSGGKTPAPVYAELAKAGIDWRNVYQTFGDERNAPSDDPQNNYKMAFDSLISKITIPTGNILRIKTELGLKEAAEVYEHSLISLKNNLGRDYLFDLVILGIGNDGHTASLFPRTEALNEPSKFVVANNVPQLNTERITLTYPAILSSKSIVFLVNDPSKEPILQQVLNGDNLPAGYVNKNSKNVRWIIGE